MKSIYTSVIFTRQFFKWTLAAWLLVPGLATVKATEPIYQNFQVLNYAIPGNPPPLIDAFSFDNENQFNVQFNEPPEGSVEAEDGGFQFYEPYNTVNYTNNSSGIDTGIMTANTPFLTNTFFGEFTIGLFDYNSTGVGYQFDTQTTNNNNTTHEEAGTFYNSGDIRVDSVIDGNNTFEGTFFLGDLGQCLVWATNILCPGTIECGMDGFIQLTGQHVDLSRGDLIMEQTFSQGLTPTNVAGSVISEGEGYDTNGDWNPGLDLTATTARSSAPDNLILTNSTPYYNEIVNVTPTTTNVLVRAVFLQNVNTNAADTVWVAPNLFGGLDSGALIQWAGVFTNPATGLVYTNYLYMHHFYFDSTNFFPVVTFNQAPVFGFQGYFDYVWDQTTPFVVPAAPTSPGYPGFNDSFITNIYEYFNGQLDGTTSATNASNFNPSGAFTNLPGRVQISALQDLNLSNTIISGANYLSLNSPHQYNGNPGATIVSPFSDINLGVTNGNLVISNLLEGNILTWSGTLDGWSARWTNVDVNGIHWDYRVWLVNADLSPLLQPQVQNLTLTTTNLIISDSLNIIGNLSSSAQSLTLTTNFFGLGAQSPAGGLNLLNDNPTAWSWNGSFPNLLCLTNNGAILMPNFSDFISDSQTNVVSTGSPAIAASAMLVEAAGTNVAANTTVTVGAANYVFVGKFANATPYQVMIGNTFDGSMSNLIAAINAGAGAGIMYSNAFANPAATAGALASHAFVVSASSNYVGTAGNGIAVQAGGTNVMWVMATAPGDPASVLSGGVNAVPPSTNTVTSTGPYTAIINNGMIMDDGSTLWVNNFMNSGTITNGTGSFILNAQTATLTNGYLSAGGDAEFTANTLEISNLVLQAGRSVVLQVTNWLTDDGISNANDWTVGATNGTGGNGLVLPFLPTNTTPGLNNLLGTTISLVAPPPNKGISSTWAGLDYGANTLGYNTNNVAIGQLSLDSLSASSVFYFAGPTGPGTNYAIYVDHLILNDYASYTNGEGSGSIPTLFFNNNITIYYADATASGQDVSYLLNHANQGHLRWVPEYTGHFSSVSVVYANGTTNILNAGLVDSPFLDSNGNGIPNAADPEPIFVPSQINFKFALTNVSGTPMALLTWDSIPAATNYILYVTNLQEYMTNMQPQSWMIVTNFVSPATVPPPAGWPITNVLVEPLDLTSPHGYYRAAVSPNTTDLYGP